MSNNYIADATDNKHDVAAAHDDVDDDGQSLKARCTLCIGL